MEHLEPRDAARYLLDHAQALFIDCRSDMEYRFAGHPAGAVNVAWNDGPGWEINPQFVEAVTHLAGADRTRPVLLICRSGERSVAAGQALEAAGFTRIHTVLHGFDGDIGPDCQRGGINGWRCDGLPWGTSPCRSCGGHPLATSVNRVEQKSAP